MSLLGLCAFCGCGEADGDSGAVPAPRRDAGLTDVARSYPDTAAGRFGPDVATTSGLNPEGETCGNSTDDDHDGSVDEGCPCAPGARQACYPRERTEIGRGACRAGEQRCDGAGEIGVLSACVGAVAPTAEVCGNSVDDNCDGTVDEGCARICNIALNIDGDCVSTSCPAECPYPVGCDLMMEGGDPRGCVASSPGVSVVYFQEGNRCGAGHVTGMLRCSSVVGTGLNAMNCPINKPTPIYAASRSGCPDTGFF